MASIHETLAMIQQLSETDKNRLLQALSQQIQESVKPNEPLIKDIREKRNEEGFLCPNCGSKLVIRFGTYFVQSVKRQRYRCSQCHKTSTDLTRTPLDGTWYSDKWIPFIEGMIDGLSLRRQAASLKISLPTAFRWRHKVLTALERLTSNTFNGIIEMDETYFLYSEKGTKQTLRLPRKRGGHSAKRGISHDQVCVLVARDRQGTTYMHTKGHGRLLTSQLDKVISPLLSNDNVFCTDAWRAFNTYTKNKKLPHYRFKSTEKTRVIKGIYHIQNANSYHSRLKRWMIRFNGVATKYLDHYLAWFHFLDRMGFENTDHTVKTMMVTACTA
ncbi:IS1595 family transposase [Sporolactobacillus spathodeae]|uniref:Transposase-like protein n=1 Tax=Sporolactobacillus spathodeae TaxID=1465502 RepID=A0ABS2Q7M1_9BACL|nr:IS1595 family transposase [Sporolactobacillus spathodeae]MBM7657775.1 transposase-like protein [Sporolactobacillus spathodeae]